MHGLAVYNQVCLSLHAQAFLVQYTPRECVVMSGDTGSDAKKIKQMLQRNNAVVTERKRSKNVFKINF